MAISLGILTQHFQTNPFVDDLVTHRDGQARLAAWEQLGEGQAKAQGVCLHCLGPGTED